MKCPNIQDLQFDKESQKAIAEIRYVLKNAKIGAALTGGAVMINIFYRNNALVASYNIYQTDWDVVSNAIGTWPQILKFKIKDIAADQAFRKDIEPKQRQFWGALVDGCQF